MNEQQPAPAERDEKGTSAEKVEERDVALAQIRLTRPLGVSEDNPGGDPYNSTGKFERIFR